MRQTNNIEPLRYMAEQLGYSLEKPESEK
jgi:hypothetical protein